jgi:hypothetical protein
MQSHGVVFKPVGDFADMLFAIGIIQVLARGKNFDGLGPAANKAIQQAGMKTFLYM